MSNESAWGFWVFPLAFANGLLAGLLAFIPNLGPFISVIPPTAIALLEAPWKGRCCGHSIHCDSAATKATILTPLVMKRQVSLLPAVSPSYLKSFLWYFLAFLGLLLALPFSANFFSNGWRNFGLEMNFWGRRYE